MISEPDPKMCITVVSTVTANGTKLPIWAIARRTTKKCEEKFRKNILLRRFFGTKQLIVTHSPNEYASDEEEREEILLEWTDDEEEEQPAPESKS